MGAAERSGMKKNKGKIAISSHNVFLTKLWIVSLRNALVAWTSEYRERTILELVQHLQKVAMATTARGGESIEGTLMTWHH